MKRKLILAVTIVLAGCSAITEQPKPPDTQADRAAINKLRDEFIAAFNANDAARVGNVYSETAVLMDEGQPTVQGRAAIVAVNKALFDNYTAKVSIESRAMSVSGDLGFDAGTVVTEVTPRAGAAKPITSEGRYLVVLQRGIDGWKVIEDIGNVGMPPTPPAAKAKPGK